MTRRIVLATGAFDLIHYGHVRFLEESKKAAGRKSRLVVVVARDRTVQRRKGKKPILPEDQRRAIVEALKPVDAAILGYEKMDLRKVIEKVKPRIIAVGHDQTDIFRSLKRLTCEKNMKFRVVQIGRFGRANLNSSSKIKRKVIEEWRS